MTTERSMFNFYNSTNVAAVTLANYTTADTPGMGTATVTAASAIELDLSSVLHVPIMANRRLSVHASAKKGRSAAFVHNRREVRRGDSIMATGHVNNSFQYVLDVVERI